MPTHEHVVHGRLHRRRLTKAKSGTWHYRVYDASSGKLHKVSTHTKVRRDAEAFTQAWNEVREASGLNLLSVPERATDDAEADEVECDDPACEAASSSR